MKIILTQEVARLGGAGDVVEVKDGYGRNYLLPRGYGIRWTRGGEKQVASIQRARDVRSVRDTDTAASVKAQIEELAVSLKARAGDTGRLFGAITPVDIVDAVLAAGGPQLDKRRVEIGAPIKTVGKHQVSVRVHSEVSATINLEVVPA